MKHLPRSFALGVTLSVVACCHKPAPAPPSGTPTATLPPPPPTPSPPPPASSSAPEAAAPVGTWTSSGCGPRRYERRLTLAIDGSASGEERVSPCPPDVACVWSGIVAWKGTYRLEGERLTILPDADAPRHPGASLPSELRWDAAAGVLVETSDGTSCPYARFEAGAPR